MSVTDSLPFSIRVVDVGDPLALPLLQPGDITYLGSLTPATDTRWVVAGKGKQAGTVYCNQRYNQSSIGLSSLPALDGTASIITAVMDLPLSSVWTDATESPVAGGFYYHAATDRLLHTRWSNYDNQSQKKSLQPLDPDTFAAIGVPHTIRETVSDNLRKHTGMCGPVPAEWQSLLGGDTFIAGGPKSIISNAAPGMAAMVFAGSQVDGSGTEIAANVLVEHTNDSQDPSRWLFRETTTIAGAAIVPGTRTMMFWGAEGTGPYCYGTGGASGGVCVDPCSPYQGTHAYPYRWSVWLYDIADFLDVMSGTKARHEPRPYNLGAGGEWDALGTALPGPPGADDCANARSHSHFFDPATMRFYVGSGDTVHVYEVAI